MFPALTSEFMKAENDYRYSRSRRSFLEHGGTGQKRRGTSLVHHQPSAARAVT